MKEDNNRQLAQRIDRRLRKALTNYDMIDNGDRVLVGLSGGKDSLCLLELLARRSRIDKPRFDMAAIHVSMTNVGYGTDLAFLHDICRANGVTLHVVETSYDNREGNTKPACFLCSWHRRKALFRFAQDNGFNKIALGHHMDDIIHTAMLNQFFQGSFSTMPAVMQMTKMPITIIRPLCLQHEDDLAAKAMERHYVRETKKCPYETQSHRTTMKELFKQIEKHNAEARYSMWHALEKEGKLIEKD